MRKLFYLNRAKSVPVSVRVFLFIVLTLGVQVNQSYAQCSGCTSTVNTNSNINAGAGQVICLTYTGGNYTRTITLNGGTVCIGTGVNVIGNINTNTASTIINNGSISSNLNNFNAGFVLNNYGTYTGNISLGGGSVTNYSGGTFTPSGITFNSGSVTNNSGGNMTLPTLTINSGCTLTNNGNATLGGITVNSGGTVSLNGTQTISGNVNNNGSFTLAGPSTISGSLTNNSGATTNLSGGITITSSVTNNGTINLAGNLSINGNYNDNAGATIKETQSGCNTLTISGSNNGGNGTFNGNGNGFIINTAPASSGSMINGASATITVPAQQPTGLSVPLTGLTVNGSFTSPSATITGYIVLRYIGSSAPSDNPVNNTVYSVGNTIGSSTVVALVAGGSAGSKTFTDNIPAGNCGLNVYYRIFSYNGASACKSYDLSSPLTGSVAIPAFTTSITPSGATTFCAGGSVTLTATGGGTYAWSTGATTAAIAATTAGTYTVTVTNAAGCTATASQVVTVNPLPTPTVNNAISCSGAAATLTATGGATYHWNTGATTPSISVGIGTYTVTVTDALTCSATASGTVTFVANPTPTVNSATICNGSSATLTATGGVSYAWNTGAVTTSITVSPASTTTYIVTATNASGCSAAASGTVTVLASPTATITPGGATTFCAGGNVTLTASGGLTYAWSTGAITAAISASTSGTYTVTVTNAALCTATASQVVTVNALPTPTVNNATSCSGSTVTLTATGGVSYHWSTGAVTTSITTAVAGVYTVTAMNAAGCTATASGTVTAAANPTPTVNNATICNGSSATLTATGGASYVWNTGAVTTSISVSPVANTTYTVTATSAAGCTATASGTVTVNANPTATITPTGATTFCSGGSVTLTASGGISYSWSTGAATAAISASAAGTYTVTVTNAAGCTATASQVVTVNPLPVPVVNNPTMCVGTSATLTVSGGASYHWNTGATTTSITVSPAVTVSYTVTVTSASGCTAVGTGTVTVASNPVVTVNNPAVCAGSTATVTATGGGTYLWSTGATTNSITTTTAGVYSVTVTNASSCTATGSGIVTVNAIPTPTVNSPTICSGAIATLTATGGAAYVWSTGAHTTSITTVIAGTYTVTATSMGSCTATASGTVTIVASPTVTVTNGVICSGTPATVTASGAASYVWSTGAGTTSITVASAGTYTVTGTSAAGCTASANSSVTAAAKPAPTVNSPAICSGNSATLTATGGVSYVWSTGAVTTSISVSPVANTTYTVTATNAAGCTASASGTVTVNALPVASATNGVVCTGAPTSPATLTASGGGTYLWSTGATTASITSLVVGSYTVTVTNAAGCTASATSTVTTAAKPTPTVNSSSVCKGTSVTLTATGGGTYLWNTGPTTASITVAPAATTTYTVTVTNVAGCTASASGTVTIYSLPTITASSNSPVLLNATINLTSTTSGGSIPYTYSWSGPSAFTSAVANPSVLLAQPTNGGIYTVTVSDVHSCTASANTTVILNFTSPGGITSNDALWLMANTGVSTSGSNVTTWNDQSGLANNATTVNGTSPTLVTNSVNSYPVVNFNAGGMQGAFGTAVTSSAVSSFVVAQASATSTNPSGIFSIVSTGGNDLTSTNSAVLFERATNQIATLRNNATRGNYTNANAIGQYHLETSIFSSATSQNLFYSEGGNANVAGYASTAFNTSLYTVGSRYTGAASNYLKGQIAEVVLFNTQLSAAQKNQVESYLATKYGFTLNQTTATNYVASNGGIFWNAASNGTYKNNIFGVGIDNISTLNQTQSVSINTSLLTINNAVGLTYYSFLMVSDNAGSNTVTAASNLPNNINADLPLTWRVSQTGSRASANYVFNSSTTSYGYYAPIASSMSVYMLIDSNADGVYETYLSPTATAGTNYTFNAYLNDGALFTFGFKASIDFGDAPGVPTLMASNGAGHMIVPGVYLGALIDAEADGQPSFNSLGDDTIGLADEDGVNFNIGVPTTSNIVTMGTNTIIVTASVPGYLNAWADFNQDNTYGGGSEYAIQNVHLVAGANTVTFTVSDSVEYGPTSMRFRFAQNLGDVTAPTGLATNGEVEDYKIYVTAPLVGACTNGFQNPGFELGPGPGTYIITSETNMPYWRTTATDHMIEQWYTGFNGVPAHGGSYFMELEANLYGALYQDVYTTPGTKLIWSFAHRGRMGSDTAQLRIGAPGATVYQTTAIDGTSGWGMHNGYYTVPAGQYITRLEFWAIGSYGGNNSIGNFLDDVSVASSFDYGDAPNSYGTLFASNGPYHSIIGNLYLGAGETCDGDGQPSAAANLDSLDDGVTFPAACAACNTYTVTIKAFNNTGNQATIAGWIDFNKNGIFDASERASINVPSSALTQTVSMTFTVNAFSATSASTYARFRIANDSTEIATPYGLATSGEVEDYKVPCVAVPTPVPSATPSPTCARGPLNLTATGTAPFFTWTGPNGFTSNVQNPTIASVPAADSGTYRVYAVYANGCETDSAVKVTIKNCFVNLSGNIFDDANGDGIIDGVDATTDLGQTVYAVLSDNTNTVLATALIAANGGFTFSNVPAYMSGMTILVRTTNPSVGATSGGPLWPPNWVGTKDQYGTNNLSGSGVDPTPNILPLSTGIANVTNALLGYDQLPITTPRNYTIPYPGINSTMSLTPSNGLGLLAGSDPEDGGFTAGSTFTITSLAGMNGNTLYYDANGDGILQPYEQITSFTTITNFDPTKLIILFTGSGSTQATFNYGTTDAAGQVDPAPATYTIKWVGTLPVKMIYFTADKLDNTQSLLKWATASEIDNDHFEIERSADAENWEKIGQQKGAGTTDIQTNYSMIDAQPLQGINYYRLKQVDVDGNYEYSQIAQVTFNDASPVSSTTLSVYPNPLNQASKLNIELASATDNISEISITNAVGQTVYSTALPQIQSYQIFGLNLPSGVYIVSVHTQTNTLITTRLVIEH